MKDEIGGRVRSAVDGNGGGSSLCFLCLRGFWVEFGYTMFWAIERHEIKSYTCLFIQKNRRETLENSGASRRHNPCWTWNPSWTWFLLSSLTRISTWTLDFWFLGLLYMLLDPCRPYTHVLGLIGSRNHGQTRQGQTFPVWPEKLHTWLFRLPWCILRIFFFNAASHDFIKLLLSPLTCLGRILVKKHPPKLVWQLRQKLPSFAAWPPSFVLIITPSSELQMLWFQKI